MIPASFLKEIIVSNERFILEHAGRIVGREGLRIPEKLKKTVVLYGARRSGKTFILFDFFRRNKDRALYLDFEDERLDGFRLEDFERLRSAFLELRPHLAGREIAFFLDEVQNVAGWERFCRRAVERDGARVFVSGSSSKIMPAEIHTELRGRSWGLEVLPFSFREYLRFKGLDPEDERVLYGPKKALAKRHFSDYLRWGGFPEVAALESELDKAKLLKEYMGAMYFRDLVERYGVTNVTLLERLSDKLFSSFSLKLSLTSVYKQYKDSFPLSKDLLFRYYKHFLQSMLVFETRKFAESPYARTRNPAKIYLVDTGMARRVTSADQGRLLENAVYLELRRRGGELFYHEARGECDFILRRDDAPPLAVQVTLEMHDGNRARELAGLSEACRRLSAREGMILTYDDESESEADGVKARAIPAWRWALQAG